MNPIAISVLLGLTAAGANVFGGAIIVQKHWERRYLKYFIALGAGFMLAVAMIEMLPQSLQRAGTRGPIYILLGYMMVHFFEHTLSPHFHFGEETHPENFERAHKGYTVLLGLLIHTFFDGIAITSGFLISNWLGWIIFLGVFLHKVPEGFTMASVMLASGSSRLTAFSAAGMLGFATLCGVLTMGALQRWINVGFPLAAGVTIYVAASDLVPEVNKEHGLAVPLVVFLGVMVFFLLDRAFHGV